MKRRPLFSLLVIIVSLSVLGCSEAEQDETGSADTESEKQANSKAAYVEQAEFTDFDGDTVSVADFKGKVVMIDLWETWCKPCISSFPTLQELQEDYPEDFAVLAVTPGFTDTKEDAQSFARENDYDFTYLMDSNGLHKKLGVQGIPYKIFVDAEGNFIKESMGSYGPDEDYKKIKEIIENNRRLKD